MKRSNSLLLLALASHFAAPACRGSVLITIAQSGSDVVASGSGTINTTALTSGVVIGQGLVRGTSTYTAIVGPPGSVVTAFFSSVLGPTALGASSSFHIASSGTGDLIGVFDSGLILPSGYVSGSSLSGMSVYTGATLPLLGLTAGSYTWTWGAGATADSLTLNIGAIPEPSETLAVAGAVCLGVAFLRRWQRNR
jgi:hypothetical protein